MAFASLIDTFLSVGVPPPTTGTLPAGLLEGLAAVEYDPKLSPWSGDRIQPKTREQRSSWFWNNALKRGAQTWLAVHAALTIDSGLKKPAEGEYANAVVTEYAILDLADLMLPFIKEQTAYIAGVALHQSETNLPSLLALLDDIKVRVGVTYRAGELSLGGWVRATVQNLMKLGRSRPGCGGFSVRQNRLAQDVLYIKRGCPCMAKSMVNKALTKHEQALTETHPRLAQDDELRDRVRDVLRVLVTRLFRGKVLSGHLPFPSFHASLEKKQTHGGAASELVEQAIGNMIDSVDVGILSSQLDRMWENPRSGRVTEVRLPESATRVMHIFASTTEAKAGADLAKGFHAAAIPCPIIEPCKVRMITMGPSGYYELALSLQKMMWGVLRLTKTFQWVGKPISEEDWAEAFDPQELMQLIQEGRRTGDPLNLVSGDYSAATDNLDPEFSLLCWRVIAENVTTTDGVPLIETQWFALGEQCLVGHLLFYRAQRKKILMCIDAQRANYHVLMSSEGTYIDEIQDAKLQQWGQLMGSPMSFPILNLINAAATLVGLGLNPAAPRETEGVTDEEMECVVQHALEEHRVHTNGDDIAFTARVSLYDSWKRTVSAVGLSPSIGKNYTSESFLIINSEMHMLIRVEGPVTSDFVDADGVYDWKPIGFLNLPILFGMESKGSHAGSQVLETLCPFDLGSLARALVWECEPDEACRRMERFVTEYGAVLNKAPPGVIWECPESLGGLGLPRFRSVSPPIEALARCAYLACLDPLHRAKEVTPPSARPFGNAQRMLRRAMEAPITLAQLVDRESVVPEGLERFLASSAATRANRLGGRSAILARFLSEHISEALESGQGRLYTPVDRMWNADEVSLRKRHIDPEAFETTRRIQKWRMSVTKQNNRAKRLVEQFRAEQAHNEKCAPEDQTHHALRPMTVEAMFTWADNRVLQEVSIDYDIPEPENPIPGVDVTTLGPEFALPFVRRDDELLELSISLLGDVPARDLVNDANAAVFESWKRDLRTTASTLGVSSARLAAYLGSDE